MYAVLKILGYILLSMFIATYVPRIREGIIVMKIKEIRPEIAVSHMKHRYFISEDYPSTEP